MEEDNNKIKGEITEHSFLMDINIIEAPMFTFKQNRTIKKIKDWEKDERVSLLAKNIMRRYEATGKENQMEYMRWEDSKGLEREFCVISAQALPSGFDMDVFYALVSLLIKQESPVEYNQEKEVYELKNDTLFCKISDITKFLGLSKGGRNNEKVRDAIDRLKTAQYYSLSNGVLFNGRTKEYISSERSESLIVAFEFKAKGTDTFENNLQCNVMVQLNKMVITNIKYSFIKFLNNRQYFSLDTGLPRRLYSYIESNKYTSKGARTYIKRKFDVLRHKIPLEIHYNSRFKKRLEKPLNSLIEHGIINGYFFGDEIHINGVREDCIYIYFKGTQAQLIKSLTKEPKKLINLEDKKKEELEENSNLIFPKDLDFELKEIGITPDKISSIIKTYGKYKIAEHILWIKDMISNNKAKNPSGLFIFSLDNITVRSTHSHISDFIEAYRKETEKKNNLDLEKIKEEYEKYYKTELDLFMQEEDFMFDTISASVLMDLEQACEKRIKKIQMMYNISTSAEDKTNLLTQIDDWKAFSKEKKESKLYKEEFGKRFRLYRNVKSLEEFKLTYK